jgi:hypothetical protein
MIEAQKYKKEIEWIIQRYQESKSWEEIRMMSLTSESELSSGLEFMIRTSSWASDLNVSLWFKIVEFQKQRIMEQIELDLARGGSIVSTKDYENELTVPNYDRGSWTLYKRHLSTQGISSEGINQIESSTFKILRRLSLDIKESGIIKGQVVGYVQSGKTANMAALMAMCADHGFNMFIILSGTIENLRKQTQTRLFDDLNHNGSLVWKQIQNPEPNSHDNSEIRKFVI